MIGGVVIGGVFTRRSLGEGGVIGGLVIGGFLPAVALAKEGVIGFKNLDL